MKNKRASESRLTRRQLLGSAAAAVVLPRQLALGQGTNPAQKGKEAGQRSRSSAFGFPSIGIEVERQAVLLAIDDFLLPLKKNLCYYLSKPKVRKEPVLAPSPNQPDGLAADFTGTVLADGGKFRMWYLANHRAPTENEDGGIGLNHLCYAESQDGIHWTKPNLGQVVFNGSRNNNAIAIPNPRADGVALIKDEEDPNPQRRYKLVYQWRHTGKYWTIRTATSPNGINDWAAGPELPIANFIEFGSFYKHEGLYIINAQTLSPFWRSEGGHLTGRQGVAWVSPDFDHWLAEATESFFLPEPAPEDRGGDKPYDQVHLGTGAASFGNVLVGLYCIWHEGGKPGDGFGYAVTSGDFGLVVSHDGLHFREPVKGHIYLAAEESPAGGASDASKYPTVLVQGNGILNVGEETRLYYGRWLNRKSPDWHGEIALATLPRDRWGALGLFPSQSEGSVWSAPITLMRGRRQITLNAEDATGMQVEISDERFQLLPGHSGGNSGRVQVKEGLDCPVSWPKEDLSGLAGKTVRLRVHLKKHVEGPDPKLYAVDLKT